MHLQNGCLLYTSDAADEEDSVDLGGRKAIGKVMKNQPAVFLKLLVLFVPKEMQIEPKGGVKAMTEDQIVQAIDAIESYLARRSGEAAKVIEGTAELAALPAPEAQSIGVGLEPKRQRRPRERMPRKVRPPPGS